MKPIQTLNRAWSDLWRPPPRLSISQWADRYAWLPAEGNAEPGKFRLARLPYERAMLDDGADPTLTDCYWMIGSQLGKTLSLILICGYYMDQNPSPILCVYPTLDSAKSWAREKFTVTIGATPRLRGLIKPARSRDSENTTLNKKFPGGNITVCGSNSPSGLRQRSKRVVLCDEIDAYEPNSEGDPLEQADKRAETFHDAVKIKSSTPTVKGLSRIETGYEQSDKQRWFCPCPKCGQHQTLSWGQVRWTWLNADGKEESRPRDACYVCEHCKAELSDADRITMVERGEWRATAPFKGIRGRHLSGLYRIIGKKRAYASYLHEFVDGFLRAKSKGAFGLMVWVNTFLSETWEDAAESLEGSVLFKRREDYMTPQGAPPEILVVTVGVDVQGDRLEAEAVGWGDQEESWGLGVRLFTGDPLSPKVWADLDAWLTSATWKRRDGVKLRVNAVAIDTGGQIGGEGWSDAVHRFTKPRFARRVFAIKGASHPGRPIVQGPMRNNRRRCPVYMVGTDTAKGLLYGRLRMDAPGPGYMHFPTGLLHGYDEEFFHQLTAEKIITEFHKGFPRRRWMKPDGRRNEALDRRVYALAALVVLQPRWAQLKKRLALQHEPTDKQDVGVRHPAEGPTPAAQPKIKRRRSRSSWL